MNAATQSDHGGTLVALRGFIAATTSVSMAAGEPSPREAPQPRARWKVMAGLGVLVIATVILFRAAYYLAFSTFSPWDDEGYVLLTIKYFVAGRALYDELYTQYGPLLYEFYRCVLWLLHLPLNHDTARFMTLGLWSGSALLAGLFVLRMTGQIAVAVLTLIASFWSLYVLSNEPGHPIALCLFLVCLLPMVGSFCGSRPRLLACFGMGIFVGCLLLTKINIGVYAFLALILTMASVTPGRLASAIKGLVSVCILALPALVMQAHWYEFRARAYVLVVTLAALSVVGVHWSGPNLHYLRWRHAAAAVIGLLLLVAAVSARAILHGSSAAGLLDGAVLQNRRLGAIFYLAAPTDYAGVASAGAGAFCFFAYRYLDLHWPQHTALDSAIFFGKTLFAAFVFSVSFHVDLDALNSRAYGRLLNFALPFVWLTAISPASTASVSQQRFARLLLVAVAVLQSLTAYPVAGSQQAAATVLLNVCAGICLSDALWKVSERWIYHAGWKPARFSAASLLVALLLVQAWRAGSERRAKYEASFPLGLPGAERLRLQEGQVAAYRWLSYNLGAHADTFVTMPGLNSLYLWTQIDPPTVLNTTAWMTLLDDGAQQHIVDRLARYPHACAVCADPLVDLWLRDRKPNVRPSLVRYIDEEFRTVSKVFAFELRIRKGRPKPELSYCVRPLHSSPRGGMSRCWSGLMVLPAMKGRRITRITMTDQTTGRLLADSCVQVGMNKVDVFPEAGTRSQEPLNLATNPLALEEVSHLRLEIPLHHLVPARADPMIRLFDENGAWFASVPVQDQ
jgi:hypothetical protein